MKTLLLYYGIFYARSITAGPAQQGEIALGGACLGGAAGGAEALIVDRCAHHQEVAAGETSHPALITYTNLIDSDHMGNLSPPTPGHWRYPNYNCLSASHV